VHAEEGPRDRHQVLVWHLAGVHERQVVQRRGRPQNAMALALASRVAFDQLRVDAGGGDLAAEHLCQRAVGVATEDDPRVDLLPGQVRLPVRARPA
jgi:hypothetical protein